MNLRPIEYIYLLIALAIVAQQLVVRRGVFDPVAAATVAFFIGLIPAGRVDLKSSDEDGSVRETPLARFLRLLMGDRSP